MIYFNIVKSLTWEIPKKLKLLQKVPIRICERGESCMADISGISGSALAAFGVRQAVTANNVANLNTPDFKASSVVMEEKKEGGVTASVTRGEDSVEISKEAVDMLDTANGYGANLKALQVAERMEKDLLDIMG
jgi:flagellar basal body rod protein FlgB